MNSSQPRTDVLIPETYEVVPSSTPTLSRGQLRADGWQNIASGIGTRKDKRVYNKFTTTFLSKEECVSLYGGDGLVSKIIDSIPDDMMREWGYFQNDPTDKYDEGLLSYEMRRLRASTIFNEGAKWARLTGGALIYIGILDGRSADQPVNLAGIRNIEFLKSYDLGSVKTAESVFDEDPRSPTFGKIIQYRIQARAGNRLVDFFVHHSRCIPIFGAKTPPSAKELTNVIEALYWGTPILQKIYGDIRDFRGAFASTNSILQEFIIGKYKFSDLDEMLAAGNQDALRNRIAGIELTKSSIQAVLMGIDEEYSRDSATVTGIPDVLDRFMMLLSAVTGIPVTKLFGRSASGLNATGEGDGKNYYDTLHAAQNDLTPYIEEFGKILMAWKKLDGDMSWKWNPLAQLTEEQQANVERIKAETYRTYADADQRYMQEGVAGADEFRVIRFPDLKESDAPELPDPEQKLLTKDTPPAGTEEE